MNALPPSLSFTTLGPFLYEQRVITVLRILTDPDSDMAPAFTMLTPAQIEMIFFAARDILLQVRFAPSP